MQNTLLILTHDPRPINIDGIYDALAEQFNVTIMSFDPSKKGKIPQKIKKIDFSPFHHVLIDLPFKRIYQHPEIFSKIMNLTIYEEDAYQDVIHRSKWRGK